jgi:translocator protein
MTGLASRAELRMSFARYALVTVPAVVLLGTLSGRLSNSGFGNPWFDALARPDFMPPGWMFGVAWTLLYIMLGFALAMLLHARGARHRRPVIALFVAQLALNYAWSPVFFGLGRPVAALALIGAMIATTLALVPSLWRIRRGAALLLLPYLGWLGFAAALNYEIVRLNPDAAALAPAGARADIPL